MHFHRDMLAICDGYGRACAARAADRPSSSARRRSPSPSGSAGWCCSRCASAPPTCCWNARRRTTCSPPSRSTARPSASPRRPPIAPCSAKLAEHDISSLRKCVSRRRGAAEGRRSTPGTPRPASSMLDGIGATEMLHIFIGSPRGRDPAGRHRPAGARLRGARGRRRTAARSRPARSAGSPCAGRPAAAISPTSARRNYVSDGWNITGDTYLQDADGYFWYQARSDDMIVSAGYNIAGPEVEIGAARRIRRSPNAAWSARRTRSAADRARPTSCCVPATRRRRDLTKAAAGPRQGDDRALQVSARHRISSTRCRAPQTGKLQRFELRRMAGEAASRQLAS